MHFGYMDPSKVDFIGVRRASKGSIGSHKVSTVLLWLYWVLCIVQFGRYNCVRQVRP